MGRIHIFSFMAKPSQPTSLMNKTVSPFNTRTSEFDSIQVKSPYHSFRIGVLT